MLTININNKTRAHRSCYKQSGSTVQFEFERRTHAEAARTTVCSRLRKAELRNQTADGDSNTNTTQTLYTTTVLCLIKIRYCFVLYSNSSSSTIYCTLPHMRVDGRACSLSGEALDMLGQLNIVRSSIPRPSNQP